MPWIEEAYKHNTMRENYRFLLETILYQMNTDASDYADRSYIHQKDYITYFLDHISENHKKRLFKIIPSEILQKKLLDIEIGFGIYGDHDDNKLYNEISDAIQNELNGTYNSGCITCGCSAKKDSVGHRICYCDACSLSECTYID
uniref:Uncharacterized protein n=1 Tax=viral metagenome TaxID=1070528 RepID=A0A6C0D821_9ZZZZ